MKASAITIGGESVPWQRGVIWLLFLGPFFFISYGFSNRVAAERAVTDSIVFGWEQYIPFLPWTILPYWSIDLFYGLSFLCCRDRMQVDRHALRLLTAQLVCVSIFLLFPLHFTFERPPTNGVFGAMFDALMGFDQPYNQAPSLHIALLVIIWVRFALAVPQVWQWVVHGWALLIGLSVLTTYQHHFVDSPTGALVGLLCLWLWPDAGALPTARGRAGDRGEHRRLAGGYAVAGVSFAGAALWLGGGALWLLWVAVALGMVALIYLHPGASAFQKSNGEHSVAVRVLLAPYLAGAWLNSRWWTRRSPQPDPIADNVWLGRMPTRDEMRSGRFAALCDLTAELPAPRGDWHYIGLQWLDLVTPEPDQLIEAARAIEALHVRGPVLVCCALGYSRSAVAVAAWLLLSGRAVDVDDALSIIRRGRQHAVLTYRHRTVLEKLPRRSDG
ncbi:MAG: phosphatase PAP2/dual specificity phosphatase family protein [Rhodocyclales bacterium]|nr:phosphatase PAP2/dual specificity phosphatase family protein [Rhodocyclales bacterium]